MAVERIGYTTVVNTGGSQDVTIGPTGGTILEGDWMVMVVTANQSQVLTVPTGWTSIKNMQVSGTLSTAIFTKKRTSTDNTYALHVTAGTLVTVSLMWFRGVADTGWVIGTGMNRSATGSTFNNIAPSIATTGSMMALTISTERTTAAEVSYTSVSGTTPWFYYGQSGSYIETTFVGYKDMPTAGTTGDVTVVYPNTQASNGYGIQIGIPASQAPAAPMGPLRLYIGGQEQAVTATYWNGTAEVPTPTVQPYNGNWHISDLLSTTPFYIAHRGGGANWPEHTMRSYTSAANWGMKAIEISCLITSDGKIVCHHDASTLRMTGVDMNIGASTKAQLDTLSNTAAFTDYPSQPNQPIPLLTDVLDKLGNSHVLFIEPKIGGSWQLDTLMPLIQSKVSDPTRVIWKQPINSGQWGNAKARGWGTWGYVLSQDTNHTNFLDTLIPQANVDMIGVERIASDAFILDIVARANAVGKKVIMWEIRSIADRDRALALGCVGMMTSNIRVVLPKFP